MMREVGRGRAWVAAVVLLGVMVGISGCSGGATSPTAASGSASAAGTVVVGGTGAPSGAAGSDSGATAGPGAATSKPAQPPSLAPQGPTIDATAKGIATFGSPTGNLACAMSKGETAGFQSVRCDVLNHSWALPPKPADCQFDWSHGAYIEGGKAALTCASDALIGADSPGQDGTWWADRAGAQRVSFSGRADVVALAYGASMKLGTITCTSQTDGMHCTDAKTGGGFDLSRTAYRLR